MHDEDSLAERLRDLGRQPVDPATSSRHLSAMAALEPSPGRFWTRLKVGAAFGIGLLVGGTGLASAGALPGPAQGVANKTLAKVGVNVPQGTERFNDPAVCGTDPSGQPFKNHGQYVKANKGNPAAAQSRCGKPLQAGGPDGASPSAPGGAPADPDQGRGSSSPGNSGKTEDKAAKAEAKAAKNAAKAERKKAEAEQKQAGQPTEPPKEPKSEPPRSEGKPATTVTTAGTTTTSTSAPPQP